MLEPFLGENLELHFFLPLTPGGGRGLPRGKGPGVSQPPGAHILASVDRLVTCT